MKWFKHDSDATSDAKIKKLIIRHGAIGYAVYFHCLELIAGDISKHNLTFELEHDSEIIADNLKITGTNQKSGAEIVEGIMISLLDLNLFQSFNNHIFCIKLAKRLDSSMTSNPEFRKLIQNSHDSVMISHDRVMQEEKRTEEKRTEEKEDNSHDSVMTKSVYQPYIPPTNPGDGLGKRIQQAIDYWNSKTASERKDTIPHCRYLHSQLPDIGSITTKFAVFTQDDIYKAIDNLEICWRKIEPKYQPRSFHGFIHKIDSWLDSANPLEKYNIKKTAEPKIEDFRYQQYSDPIIEENIRVLEEQGPASFDIGKLKEKYS